LVNTHWLVSARQVRPSGQVKTQAPFDSVDPLGHANVQLAEPPTLSPPPSAFFDPAYEQEPLTLVFALLQVLVWMFVRYGQLWVYEITAAMAAWGELKLALKEPHFQSPPVPVALTKTRAVVVD
jgi:hypothetical protein